MAKKISVTLGVTTVDLQLSGQTVRLRVEEAEQVARDIADAARRLREMIFSAHSRSISGASWQRSSGAAGSGMCSRRGVYDAIRPDVDAVAIALALQKLLQEK